MGTMDGLICKSQHDPQISAGDPQEYWHISFLKAGDELLDLRPATQHGRSMGASDFEPLEIYRTSSQMFVYFAVKKDHIPQSTGFWVVSLLTAMCSGRSISLFPASLI